MLDYQLIDFGAGRRLERFGSLVLDRLCPSAHLARPAGHVTRADLCFVDDRLGDSALGKRGYWTALTDRGRELLGGASRAESPEGRWQIRHTDPDFTLDLACSPFGHIGVFPEQEENWCRIGRYVRRALPRLGRPPKVLNLFAYTGASSLAAASAGAEVTHLDAARNIVDRARQNASLSSVQDRIRFITDDAMKFVQRQGRRGNRYDALILDPPSYGHGARGEVWRLARDLPKLLGALSRVLDVTFPMVLLTCHTPSVTTRTLAAMLREKFPGRGGNVLRIETGMMKLTARAAQTISTTVEVRGTGGVRVLESGLFAVLEPNTGR